MTKRPSTYVAQRTGSAFALLLLAGYVCADNLLPNASFETPGMGNAAYYWSYGDPDSSGGYAGSAMRFGGEARTGNAVMAFPGNWSGVMGDMAGIWRQVTVESNHWYHFSGWFRADDGWTATSLRMILTFIDGDFNISGEYTSEVYPQTTMWQRHVIVKQAPESAQWLNVAIFAEGIGTNGLLRIDDLYLLKHTYGGVRETDFATWPVSHEAAGCHTHDGWTVCTGRVIATHSQSGKAAEISSDLFHTNYLQSPLYPDGFGTISFTYRRGAQGPAPVGWVLEYSQDDVIWVELDRIPIVESEIYETYTRAFFYPNLATIRIRTLALTNAPGSTLLLEERFDGGTNPPPGWVFEDIDQYIHPISSGESPPALQFGSMGSHVITPDLQHPTNLWFWYKGNNISPTNALLIEGLTTDGWTSITNMVPLVNNVGTDVSLSLETNVTRLRFTYTKYSGNLAFDDVVVRGLIPPDPPPQDLIIDTISIGVASDLRTQTFDTWPSAPAYGSHYFNGWRVGHQGLVDTHKSYIGKAARLRNTHASGAQQPYIQSPFYDDGIGVIRFRYRHWVDTGPAVESQIITAAIQISSNETDWVTLDTLAISNVVYALYERNATLTNGPYTARIRVLSGNERVLIDEIQILPPGDFGLEPPVLHSMNADSNELLVQITGNTNYWHVTAEYTTNLVSDPVIWNSAGSQLISHVGGGTNRVWLDSPPLSGPRFYRFLFFGPDHDAGE